MVFSPDDRLLAIEGERQRFVSDRNWRQAMWDMIESFWKGPRTPSGNVFPVHEVRLYEVDTGHLLATLPNSKHMVFSPDGKTLATVTPEHRVQLWDVPPRRRWGQSLTWASVVALTVMFLGVAIHRLLVGRYRWGWR
jgi:hypothetical protein